MPSDEKDLLEVLDFLATCGSGVLQDGVLIPCTKPASWWARCKHCKAVQLLCSDSVNALILKNPLIRCTVCQAKGHFMQNFTYAHVNPEATR